MLKKLLNWKVGLIVGVSTAAFIAIVASPLVAQKSETRDYQKKYSLLNRDITKAKELSSTFALPKAKFQELAQQLSLNSLYKNKLSAQTALDLHNDKSYVFELVNAVDFTPFTELDPNMKFELRTVTPTENSGLLTTVENNTIKNVILTGIDTTNHIYYESTGNISGFGTSDGQDTGDFFIDQFRSGLEVHSNIAFGDKPATLTALALEQAFDQAYQEFKAPVAPTAPATGSATTQTPTETTTPEANSATQASQSSESQTAPAPQASGTEAAQPAAKETTSVAKVETKRDYSNAAARAFAAMLPKTASLNLINRQGNATLLPQGYILEPKLVNDKLSFTNLDDVNKTLSLEMQIIRPDKTVIPVELSVTNLSQVESNFANEIQTNFSKSYRIKPELAQLLNDTGLSLASIIYADAIPKALTDYVTPATPAAPAQTTTPAAPATEQEATPAENQTQSGSSDQVASTQTQQPTTSESQTSQSSTTPPTQSGQAASSSESSAATETSTGTEKAKSAEGTSKVVIPTKAEGRVSDAVVKLFEGKTLADLQKFDFWYEKTTDLSGLLNTNNNALQKYSNFSVDFAKNANGTLTQPSQSDVANGKILFNFDYATTFAKPIKLPSGVKVNPDQENSVLQSANIEINGDVEALRGQLASLFKGLSTTINLVESKYAYTFANDLDSAFVPLAKAFEATVKAKSTTPSTTGSTQTPAASNASNAAAKAPAAKSVVSAGNTGINNAGAGFFTYLNNAGSLQDSQKQGKIKTPGDLVRSLIDKFAQSGLPNMSITSSFDGNYHISFNVQNAQASANYVITIQGIKPTSTAWSTIKQYSPTVFFDATGASVGTSEAVEGKPATLTLSDLRDKTREWKADSGVPKHDSVDGVTLGKASVSFDNKSKGLKLSDDATKLTNGSLFMAFSVDQLPKGIDKLYLLKSAVSSDDKDKAPQTINVFIQKTPKLDTSVKTELESVKDSYIIGLEYGAEPATAGAGAAANAAATSSTGTGGVAATATTTPAATIIGLFTDPTKKALTGASSGDKAIVIGKQGTQVDLGKTTFSQDVFNGYKDMEDFLITKGETLLLEINISQGTQTGGSGSTGTAAQNSKTIEFILRSSKNNDPLNKYIKSTLTFGNTGGAGGSGSAGSAVGADKGLAYLQRGIDFHTIGGRSALANQGSFNLKGFAVFNDDQTQKDAQGFTTLSRPTTRSSIAKAFIDQYFYKFKANNN